MLKYFITSTVLMALCVLVACQGREKSEIASNDEFQSPYEQKVLGVIDDDDKGFISYQNYRALKVAARRTISSTKEDQKNGVGSEKLYFENQKPPQIKNFKGKAVDGGDFEVEVTRYEHPSTHDTAIKVSVRCSPNFEEEVLVENFTVCEYEGHSYNEDKDELHLNYRLMPEVNCVTEKREACEKSGGKGCENKAYKACEDVDPCSEPRVTIWPLCKQA